MCFYYLLLGHIIGDFTFQNGKIALNKVKYINWLLLHVLIVTACILVFSIPFGKSMMLLIFINGIIHFFIDFLKLKIKINNSFLDLLYFLLDQFAHIIVIYIISKYPTTSSNLLIFNMATIKFLLAFMFIFSFGCILVQYILKCIFPNYTKKFFLENERSIGYITRVLLFFIFYFSFYTSKLLLFFIFIIIVIQGIFYNFKWRKWMTFPYFITKFLSDFWVSFIGFYLLIYIF